VMGFTTSSQITTVLTLHAVVSVESLHCFPGTAVPLPLKGPDKKNWIQASPF
jgi:hypothetical protein